MRGDALEDFIPGQTRPSIWRKQGGKLRERRKPDLMNFKNERPAQPPFLYRIASTIGMGGHASTFRSVCVRARVKTPFLAVDFTTTFLTAFCMDDSFYIQLTSAMLHTPQE